jgi:centromere-localized protein 2
MAPTEATILENYLLLPAQLPAIISLKEFTELFPRAQQSSPQVKRLYRDLQTQRNTLIDAVASNIETEARRAKALRREVLRAKREAEDHEMDDEIEIERAVG